MTLFTLFSTLSLLFLSTSGSDLRSLLEFKKGILYDPLDKIFSKWDPSSIPDPNSCPNSWPGISCDPHSDSVIAITLDHLSLSGNLKFSTLLELKSLQNISLSGNNFTGRIVPALGSMSSLQYLDLSNNNFSGPIPGRIAELWNLKYLNLSMNRFEGRFPVGSPVGFRNLQQLRVLDLSSNSFWGDISGVLSELINSERVDLSDNEFFGGFSEISVENVSGLANTLHFVNLSKNRLNSGFFKAEVIALFRNLEVLDLGDNVINGELPSFGSLTNLKVLRLGNNQLFGGIPEELINGSIPIEELDLSGNGFTAGTLSVMQQWGASVEVLDLSSNQLSGSLPNLTWFVRLSELNLRNNSLDGNLPAQLGDLSTSSSVDLSLNQFNGPIPGGFFTSLTLMNLNLSGNRFSGPIPVQDSGAGELLVLPSYPLMESLDLSQNSLSGILPSGIGNFANLRSLNLSNNNLSGQLPIQLSKLTHLQYLDLSANRFQGKIPDKLPSSLIGLNMSNNDLAGNISPNLRNKFDISSFRPGNPLLIIPNTRVEPSTNSVPDQISVHGKNHSSKHNITIAVIVATVGTAAMIAFVLLVYQRAQRKEFHGRSDFSGQTTREDAKQGRSSQTSLFNFHSNAHRPPTSLSFSNDHLLTANSRSISGQAEFETEIFEHGLHEGMLASSSIIPNLLDDHPTTPGRKSSPGSPLSSSPRFVEPTKLDVYSPDRLAGELSFLDSSLAFTAEELSRAPAEVLGRSSHGTLYKATLDSGHMLTVKWLRVGLVKHKKEFAKEVKKIGSIRHQNIVPLRAFYWGPREQERLLLADYIQGDSLALHLYETTPRRYSLLSFSQRLKVAVDVASCLLYLHDRGMLHGNLKPTNILLEGPDYNARLTDCGLHRLMTPAGIAEQILNLGALGYRAPELDNASKPAPSFKADVYAFGVILMELLTRRSAGDIISGQSGAVDLTDWVRLCDQEGRQMDCIDRDIAGGEEPTKAMDDLLAISLRCILPQNERPNIRQVFDDLCSISV
ncbi:PREDICTED: probable inactive receptor kinase At5g10020 [Populus euphratica]|uniref:Probable inactive receptor kinase At5g10020 n=1 Tax=Populus euphratica TaxID=75702 RepID=A0AAJ6UAL4_POPEU|nr:PREDICTED: probable inactive receptor kinase At5g10020 [Populus euphratica]